MEQHKTGESIKAGLQFEAGTNPVANTVNNNEDAAKEIDADEVVHQQQSDMVVDTNEEQDADELVHNIPTASTSTANKEADPDDLVHQQ